MRFAWIALFLALPALAARDAREFVRPRHSILVKNADGSETRLHMAALTDNGPEKPGIFFLTDHNGSIQSRLDYPLEMKWRKEPKSDLEKAAFETELRSLNRDFPHHMTLGLLQGDEAAKELLTFLETTNDAYEFIYPDKKEHKKVRRKIHRKKMRSGELAVGEFNSVEREIPSNDVIIRNRTTGEERRLSEFADVLVAKKKGDDEFLKARMGAFVTWMSGKETKAPDTRPAANSAFIQRSYVPVKANMFYVDHQDFEDDWRKDASTRNPHNGEAR